MKELTTKETIEEAVSRVRNAMIENIEAAHDETKAQLRKKAAHYELLKSQEHLRGIQMDLMSGLNI